MLDLLKSRGPDHVGSISRLIRSDSDGGDRPFHLTATSSVLSIRSDRLVEQPIVDHTDDSGSFLCWNGEAWRYRADPIQEHDADFLYHLLLATAKMSSRRLGPNTACPGPAIQAIVAVISGISGPFAFVFYDGFNQRLFYGRDVLGRRSLLSRKSFSSSLEISSVGDGFTFPAWTEVGVGGVYSIEAHGNRGIANGIHASDTEVSLSETIFTPWQLDDEPCSQPNYIHSPFPPTNRTFDASSPLIALNSPVVNSLLQRLNTSLSLRLQATPSEGEPSRHKPHVAILFSGGIDCTLIARISHSIVPAEEQIDLINVAFENPRVVKAAERAQRVKGAVDGPYELCPDRLTGRSSHRELTRLCPSRRWQFVSVNIPYAETEAHRDTIKQMIHPHKTEMDFSIGCALYFAARGCGTAQGLDGDTVPYKTPCRVLLSGLGADELFGGYSRHGAAFDRRGYPGLIEELDLDFQRLAVRNLGRDDRIVSHWGKEIRYPYLDEGLLAWALALPVIEKCSFGQNVQAHPVLEPSKRLLRLLAWKLGLTGAAKEKKRAIQFGARTAKMQSGKTSGTQLLL